jgi:two-component system sensor histidine kinase YesM
MGTGAVVISRAFLLSEQEAQAHRLLSQTMRNFTLVMNEMDTLNLTFSTNSKLRMTIEKILEKDQWEYEDFERMNLIRSYVSAPTNAHSYIDAIYVFMGGENRTILANGDGIKRIDSIPDFSLEAEASKLKQEGMFFERRTRSATENAVDLVRIIKPIHGLLHGATGFIIIDLNAKALAGELFEKALSTTQKLTITTQDGAIILSKPMDDRLPDGTQFVFSDDIPQYGLTFLLSMSKKELYALPTKIVVYTIFLTFAATLLGLFLTYKTNKKERQFLSNVIDQLQHVGMQTKLDQSEEAQYNNTFDYLNHYVLKTFLEKDYLHYQKEAMEYTALQMQINPHFLYNTLDTIYWKTYLLTHSENDACKMIGLLAKLLAYSLEPHGKQGVTLEKEIQMTNMYLEIQTIRFKKRFDFAWSVQDDLHSMRVPCMLFQPILENVFNHGFEGKKKIHITITITAVGETATICIENNGKAIDEKNLAMLNDPQTDALLQRHALGIPNTRKRLALFSGNRSSLTIENTHEGTVRVLLMLPVTYTAISPSNP